MPAHAAALDRTMSKRQRWIVTTDPQHAAGDIARELEQKGFSVDAVLAEIGSITGTATPAVARSITGIDGVVDVARDAGIDIGPPGADETW